MLAQAMRDEVRPDCTMDQPVERYTATDHAVWRRLFERQAETLRGRACDEFLGGLAGLGVAKEGIPSFDRLSEALTKATGTKVPVLGQVPIDVRLREGGDEGKPVVLTDPDSPAGSALRSIAGKLGGRQRGLSGMSLGITPRNKF